MLLYRKNNYIYNNTNYLLDLYFSVIYEIKEHEQYDNYSLIEIFKSLYISTRLNQIGDEISYFCDRFPKKYEADFIIEMFFDIYKNYNNYSKSYNFFLSKLNNYFNPDCLIKTLKMWKVSTFPIEEYADNIICNNIPEHILKKYEHPKLLKYIKNRNFETFIIGSIDKKSNIFKFFSSSSKFDKYLLLEIKKFI
jgi:hypothetical protein